jgi:hypothetical protein
MSRTNNIALMLAISALLLGCHSIRGADPAAPASTGKVECAIVLSKTQFKTGEPIPVSVTIYNRDDTPVNIAFGGHKEDYPIINFQIHGRSGNTLLVSTKQNLWCGTGVENIPVPAKQEYKFSVDLLKTWEWGGSPAELPPGTYTISAELFSTTVNGGSSIVAESGATKVTVIADE